MMECFGNPTAWSWTVWSRPVAQAAGYALTAILLGYAVLL